MAYDRSFPRLYAAASLKPGHEVALGKRLIGFSAALCRGLIEADRDGGFVLLLPGFPRLYAAASLKLAVREGEAQDGRSFPRLYAAASLKLEGDRVKDILYAPVFRGFMPRPH